MKKTILIILLAYNLWPSAGFSQTDYASVIEKYMAAQASVKGFSGVVLVAKNDGILYQKAFGYSDREWKINNTIDAKFEIGSLTKQFTAATILQLAEQHKLNLQDKLSLYFPGYPKGDNVTIQMLLNHTSGIADYTTLPRFGALHTMPLAKDSIIALFKNQPYNFSPGTKWSYSNSGYFLLGCIIEKVSKQSYADYLQQHILSKASLTNTAVNRIDSVLNLRVKGYSVSEKGSWSNAPYFSMEFPFSAGALISTVHDLNNWENSLLKGDIISKESLSQMTTPYLNHYGYGLIIDTLEGHRRISHSGAIPGFTSYLSRFPNDNISVVVLSNNESQVSGIADALSAIVFNRPFQMPYIPKEVVINYSVLQKYAGKYQIPQPSGATKFELLAEANKLYLKPDGANFKMELKPESETKFFFERDRDQEIEFILDPAGKITNHYFINKGVRLEIKKGD